MATALAVTSGIVRRPFYVGVSLLMGLIAIVGFWPTYFGPLVRGTLEQPLLIHIHAVVFAGWLVLFLTQAAFAATGRRSWHMQLGRIGIAYGALLIVVGLVTAIARSAERLDAGGAGEQLLFAATADMVMFSSFFVAAIVLRRKPQHHKRLMMIAATMLLVAATGRMTFIEARSLRLLLWVSPILVAMAYDFRRGRLIHPVYVVGLAAFAVRAFSAPLVVSTSTWSAITRWLTGLV